jgi:alkylhydroperoxidase family enzyme
MHWKDLQAAGESDQRLYSPRLARNPFSTDRERAGLTWAEAVTLIHEATFRMKSARRVSLAFRTVPGTYQLVSSQELKKGA